MAEMDPKLSFVSLLLDKLAAQKPLNLLYLVVQNWIVFQRDVFDYFDDNGDPYTSQMFLIEISTGRYIHRAQGQKVDNGVASDFDVLQSKLAEAFQETKACPGLSLEHYDPGNPFLQMPEVQDPSGILDRTLCSACEEACLRPVPKNDPIDPIEVDVSKKLKVEVHDDEYDEAQLFPYLDEPNFAQYSDEHNLAEENTPSPAKRKRTRKPKPDLVKDDSEDTPDLTSGRKIFACKYCPKTFLKSVGFYKHVKIKHGLTCLECKDPVMNFGNLVKHVAEHHPDKIEEYSRFGQHDDEELEQDMKQPLKCIKCDMVFNGNVLLHRHKQIYHEMGDYNCEECQKPCLTYYDLTVHNYEEHAKPIRYLKPYNYGLESITLDDGKIEKKRTLFVCEHCQASFNTDPGWTLHLRIQHSWGLFECKPCEEVCHYAKDMSAHVLNFHKDQPEVKCPSCPEVFCLRDDPDKFLNHYRDCSRVEAETKSKQKVEERKSENYQCDYCGKNYNSKLAFEAHILKQHQGIERYKCDQCDFGTNLKDVLKGHEKIHLRKKGLTNADTDLVLFHQCDQCGKQFSHMTTLRRHIQRVHEGIKPQYKCSDCEFFAYSNSMLYKHKREVHGFVNIFKKNGRIHSKLKE
ncbi:hypothetical protein TCAL_12901 [Tigriopus californicus]|uniref:C2H2-type domain-containing protein n=2 Tax=Tigriopus californicus TaxID=6832 RepID=A0A553NBC4_TIGCA|nr:hypothetical protein TCAL_12901 [Tigriopus californicus]|eukprot:TCALIF_12901-PA protein Name:"Similar to ZNF85 Zinc finger protein 85 (Homo sapiens)" AED:0.39 eAED:0.39 QI:0/0/0/0.5/1/1/2/0/629